MIELAYQAQELVKSVTIDIVLVVIILVVSYVFTGTHSAGLVLSGSYTLGDLIWLVMLGLIGAAVFDIGSNVSPLLALVAKKRYGGERVLDWNELVRAVTRVAILIVVWLLLISPVESLVVAFGYLINANALRALYHILFGLAIAYCGVLGALRSRATGLKQPEPLSGVHWDGLQEAVKMSEYLKRLEALESSGHIDDRTYEKLHVEYESKLRAAIEKSAGP
jgi:hypothetical protein